MGTRLHCLLPAAPSSPVLAVAPWSAGLPARTLAMMKAPRGSHFQLKDGAKQDEQQAPPANRKQGSTGSAAGGAARRGQPPAPCAHGLCGAHALAQAITLVSRVSKMDCVDRHFPGLYQEVACRCRRQKMGGHPSVQHSPPGLPTLLYLLQEAVT